MSTKTLMTAEEFAQISSETPCELVRGEIVEMSPAGMRHGVVCSNIARQLGNWAQPTSAGYVAVNDSGVVTDRNPDSVRGPDCLFVSARRLPSGARRGFLEIPPDLAVELLSPSDRWSEVIAKVGEYLSCGVLEVWVVDPQEQEVEVFRPDQRPVTLKIEAELASESILPGFRCRVADLFSEF